MKNESISFTYSILAQFKVLWFNQIFQRNISKYRLCERRKFAPIPESTLEPMPEPTLEPKPEPTPEPTPGSTPKPKPEVGCLTYPGSSQCVGSGGRGTSIPSRSECARIPSWMKKDSFGHRIVGGNNAISSIPWQVLINGTVYILEQQDFKYYLPLEHSIPSWLM